MVNTEETLIEHEKKIEKHTKMLKVILIFIAMLVIFWTVVFSVYLKCMADNNQKEEELTLVLIRQQEEIDDLKLECELQDCTDQLILDRLEDLEDSQMDLQEFEVRVEMRQLQGITDLEDYYIAYMDIVDRYSDYFGSPVSIYDLYTEREIQFLWSVVETETYCADFESKTHVANVVLNRIESPEFPNDMISVITAPNQFAYFRSNISESTILACEYAVMFPDNTDGAVAFHSGPTTPTFWGRQLVMTDAVGHNLYK